jgi:predicted nuclease with RNAse H fold
MPNANRIWMLYGFELFRALKAWGVSVIETYPQAVVRLLMNECSSKLTADGFGKQLDAVARATGWDPQRLEAALAAGCTGHRHDRLDAFMAAWVAALGPRKRTAYGNKESHDDAIWVPKKTLWSTRQTCA